MDRNADEPAFPRAFGCGGPSSEEFYAADEQEGMSLRDWFAGQALVGMLANQSVNEALNRATIAHGENDATAGLAAAAYRIARAMLEERQKEFAPCSPPSS